MRTLVWIVVLLALLAGGLFYYLTMPERVPPSMVPRHKANLENGALLFWAGGCESCHAAAKAKGDDKFKLAGGQELVTPFGTFRVPNISPDPATGIGGWSNADFITAMTKGVSPDGRHYYPAFPYMSYQRMTLTDLVDLKGFLDTLPAIEHVVGPHDLTFPFNLRRALGLWKLLYMDGKRFSPDPTVSDEINRGAYLVTGPAHCGECHTPRDMIGGPIEDRRLAGAPALEGKGFIPNITPDETGIAKWSAQDIAYALETGFTPEYDTLGGTMASVQSNMAHLPADDRAAIAAYLKSIPPVASEASDR